MGLYGRCVPARVEARGIGPVVGCAAGRVGRDDRRRDRLRPSGCGMWIEPLVLIVNAVQEEPIGDPEFFAVLHPMPALVCAQRGCLDAADISLEVRAGYRGGKRFTIEENELGQGGFVFRIAAELLDQVLHEGRHPALVLCRIEE